MKKKKREEAKKRKSTKQGKNNLKWVKPLQRLDKTDQTKYNSLEGNTKIINIIKSFIEEFNLKVIYMNKDRVLYSNIVNTGVLLNEDMKEIIVEGEELMARALCHEIDHLEGIIYKQVALRMLDPSEIETDED